MSFDLFSSIDFYLSKFSFFSIFVWVFSIILVFNLVFFKTNSFIYRVIVEIDEFLFLNLPKSLDAFIYLKWSLITLFELILLSKLAGLFPYVFGWTPHILVMLLLSLILWLTMNLSFLLKDCMSFFSHLVPQGTPVGLGMFLSMIELMSKFIRPLTLSLRLGIKMTTGHMLLGLMSILGMQFKFKIFLIMLGAGYFLFELFVMYIQAMVFTLLLSSYSEETL